MQDHDRKEKLDDLLESLLSKYSAAEPRSGLEQRILANLRQAQEPEPRFWLQPWLLTAAIAASLVTVVVVLLPRLAQNPHPVQIQVRLPVTHPERENTAWRPRVRQNRPAAGNAGSGTIVGNQDDEVRGLTLSSRPAIFPTPVPLSEQEGFMFLYLAHTPKEELVAQSHRDDDVDNTSGDDGSPSSAAPQPSGHIQ